MKKRLIALILAVIMVCTLLPVSAFAATIVDSGYCGYEYYDEFDEDYDEDSDTSKNLCWSLDSDGTLTISGTGEMQNYRNYGADAPWYSYRNSIKKLIIESGVTSIGKYAFCDCSNLTSVTISDSVNLIEDGAFENCEEIKRVDIKNLINWCLIDFEDFCSNPLKSGAKLYVNNELLTNFVAPSALSSIKNRAFMGCSSLTNVVIPDTVTSIGHAAFEDCENLINITIPDSVTSIEYSAFLWCPNLKNVYITDIGKWCNIEFANMESNPLCNGAKLYINGKILTDLVIPDEITNIGYAFSGCSSLASVTIPDSVTSIGDDAFYGCSSLTSVTIPNSVTSIGECAFRDCSALTGVTIPNSVTSIGYSAFSGCGNLTSISIPNSVTSIDHSAFSGCSNLKSVTIPDSVEVIEYEAFAGCTNLARVTISSGVTNIDYSAFYDCSNLQEFDVSADNKCYSSADGVLFNKDKTEIICFPMAKTGDYSIPSSVTNLRDGSFSDCEGLTSISVPSSVQKIGWYTFSGCTNLKSATIASGVSEIQYRAFNYCTSLTELTIPSTVKSIEPSAFSGCESLKDVYYDGTQAQWNDINIFPDNACLTNATIHFAETPDYIAAPVVSLSLSSSSAKPKLTWKTVNGAREYIIYRATSKKGTYSKLYTTTKTSYVNTGAKAGTLYYYKVKAVNANGTLSDFSNRVYIPSKCTAPVVTVKNNASSGKPKVSWEAVPYATKYVVYRATSKNGSYTKMYTTTKTSYTNTNAKAGKAYYYKVKAISDYCKDSSYSTVHSITCDLARPVVKITLSSANHPKLSWASISGASKYVVYRATSKSGTYTKMYTTTKTSYTNTNAKAGVTYYYKVIAVCSASSYGNSAYSTVVSIKAK